jgi:hypothetical protein
MDQEITQRSNSEAGLKVWPPPIPLPPAIPPVPLTKQERAIVRWRKLYAFSLGIVLIGISLLVWDHWQTGWRHGWTTQRVGDAVCLVFSLGTNAFYGVQGWRLAREVKAGRRSVSE